MISQKKIKNKIRVHPKFQTLSTMRKILSEIVVYTYRFVKGIKHGQMYYYYY